MSSIEEVFCGDCDHRFPEGAIATQPPRRPCPSCGSTVRRGTFISTVAMGVSVTALASGTLDRSWRAQYRRMRRAFDRLHGVAPVTSEFVAADIEDGFRHFFQDAWHLKDWLRNDPETRAAVQDIDEYVNRTAALQLAADLANGGKHLSLRSARTGDAATDLRTFTFEGHPSRGLQATFEVESRGKQLDAVMVAREVLAEWDEYLSSKGLRPTE